MVTYMFLLIRYSKDEKAGVLPQPAPVFGILYCVNLRKEMSKVLRSTIQLLPASPKQKQGEWVEELCCRSGCWERQ